MPYMYGVHVGTFFFFFSFLFFFTCMSYMYALHVRHICRYIYSRVLMARLTTKGNTAQHFGFMAGVSRVSGLYYYSLLLLFTTALCYYTLPQHFGFMTGASKVSGLYYYSLLLLMTTALCYYEYTLYYWSLLLLFTKACMYWVK
jgi:hypothetical protein